MAKQTTTVQRIVKNIARPGIHAKSKISNLKTSKNYKKLSLPIFRGDENSPTIVAGKPPSGLIITAFDPGISNFVRD